MTMTDTRHIRIVEVGPRDGLQNEPIPVSAEDKFQFVLKLVDAGITDIELTSFVKPGAIPQLSDAAELMEKINAHDFPPNIRFSALAPNVKGAENACNAGVKEIAVFVATSEAFSESNTHRSIAESMEQTQAVIDYVNQYNAQHPDRPPVKVRGYLSTVFGCPFREEITVLKVVKMTQELLAMGCYEVSLGDTIGVATPEQTREILDALQKSGVGMDHIAMHYHDTHHRAIKNIRVALEMGVRTFDASAGGLGGCPYAPGASGNVATEDVVQCVRDEGYTTDIDLNALVDASEFMLTLLGRESLSNVHQQIMAQRQNGNGHA